MLGFKAFDSAVATLTGIELSHMLRKGQYENAANCTVYEYLYSLAAWLRLLKNSAFALSRNCDRAGILLLYLYRTNYISDFNINKLTQLEISRHLPKMNPCLKKLNC